MPPPIIEGENDSSLYISDASYSYEKREIISHIFLVIRRGEKVLISGPSGSGKTTFLKLLGGIITPDSGTIRIGDISIAELQKNRFSLFGYAFVDGDFFEQMSVHDNIWIFPEILGVTIDKNWYEELLEYFEMSEYEKSPLEELSAGQRERVSLIRAFIHEPKIILLDEPGSHLDTALQERLINFIRMYHEKYNATFIISSHGGFENSFFDTFIDFHENHDISIR